ncbi:MAG: methyltransferase domain-containing protein [Deltaproteobacteria bacterium]|nr:MAG: methyltransferase domain-containing protein [Deltaproteobacteria bacterium]
MDKEKRKPSLEDVLELSGIEVLHPGGLELSKRISEVVDMKDKKVLDVACGRGIFACYYAKNFGATVTGVDLSQEMIESSIQRAIKEGIEDSTGFKVADALNLPFPDDSFDVVVNECAVGLTPDPQKCLNEMLRVTKPGSYVVIHESLWLKELPESEKKDIAKRLGTVPFKLSEWKDMLEKAGAVEIWDEDWSGIEQMSKIRPGRKIKKMDDTFSLWEKTAIIFPKVLKRYGLSGLSYLNESFKKTTPLFYNGTLGYCLMKGQKPKS